MKDLILIGAYCPDDERETLLFNLVNQLQEVRNDFDILICSHVVIPDYISKKVDMTFYDRDNELITDMEYMNQPWFEPFTGKLILSTLMAPVSTYLAVYKLLISGLGIAKTLNYDKVHYIEYDADFQDLDEIKLHSKLLDDYDWVAIQVPEISNINNIPWPTGNFMSFKIETLDEVFITYNREILLEKLFNSPNKTNEKITNDIMTSNGKKVFIRDFYKDVSQKNSFGLSRFTSKDSESYWVVPYYDTEEDKVYVIVWNHRDYGPIDVSFIINKEKIINFDGVKKLHWHIKEIGNINDIDSIMILLNGKVTRTLKFDEDSREIFKKTNYTKTR